MLGSSIHTSQPPYLRNDIPFVPPPSSVLYRGTEYLSRLTDRMITVSPTTGKTIADATDVFHDIDPDYFEWRLNVEGKPTQRHRLLPFEHAKDGTLWQIFRTITHPKGLLRMALEQEQITNFVREHPDLMSEGEYATLFLIKKGDDPIVASVRKREGRTRINFRHISEQDDAIWLAEEKRRVIFKIL